MVQVVTEGAMTKMQNDDLHDAREFAKAIGMLLIGCGLFSGLVWLVLTVLDFVGVAL